jgi:hypothetical protein
MQRPHDFGVGVYRQGESFTAFRTSQLTLTIARVAGI